MPVVDMPIKELQNYFGISPKPIDFDEFWDQSLEEMKQINSNLILEESEFQVPFVTCYHMYFTGMKGASIYSKLVIPKEATNSPAVIKFHGYSMDSGEWNDLLKYAALGYVAVSMDCRGQGGLSEDVGGVSGGTLFGFIIKGLDSGPKELYFRNVFLDTAQLAGLIMAMDEVDEQRVGVIGGSQGGALTIACSALEPRVKKLVPVYPFLSDYKRVWEMDLDVDAYTGLREYFRKFDPTHEFESEFFETLGYIDIQHMAKRIKGEVLFATGLIDTICPPSSQYAVYNKIEAPKQHVIYPDFGHEYLKGFSDKEYLFLLDL
jgi:cephalosporin-C deacetylase